MRQNIDTATHPILLYDGVCNLCNSSVQFTIKHDKYNRIRFAALQSEVGKALLTKHQLSEKLDSVIFIENNKAYTKSDAPLHVTKYFGGLYPLARVFLIVPKFIRNSIYDWIAKNRYRWFGKQESCMMPTPEIRARFLDL